MNKERGGVFIALLFLIAVLLFGLWYLRSPYFKFGAVNQIPEGDEEAALIEQGQEHRISMTRRGFTPERITIAPYDTVVFVNVDRAQHHPQAAGGECGAFGSPRPLLLNESYKFVFTEKGSCEFQDLSGAFPNGVITIEE